MRVIIAGSRDINDYQFVHDFIKSLDVDITTVVSGGARGVDTLGERYAYEYDIPIKRYRANWNSGKSAGIKRNILMSDNSDALIVIHNYSKGSLHMKSVMLDKGFPVYESIYQKI